MAFCRGKRISRTSLALGTCSKYVKRSILDGQGLLFLTSCSRAKVVVRPVMLPCACLASRLRHDVKYTSSIYATHTYVHAHTHTHTHTHTYMHTHTCIHEHTHCKLAHIHIDMHTSLHTHMHIWGVMVMPHLRTQKQF